MPAKKKPAKSDRKQQTLSFNAGKPKSTSDEEKQQTASTVGISNNPSAAKPPRLNEEDEEDLDEEIL